MLLGREQRKKRKGNQIDLRKELLRRQLEQQQAKDTSTRKKLEHRLKSIDIDKIRDEFHDLEDNKLDNLIAIRSGKSIGYNICPDIKDMEQCGAYGVVLQGQKAV